MSDDNDQESIASEGEEVAVGAEAVEKGTLRVEPCSAAVLEAVLARSGVGLGVAGRAGAAPWELPAAALRVWLARALAAVHPACLALWRAYHAARTEYVAAATAVARAEHAWAAPEHAAARRALERAVAHAARLETSVANLERYVAAGCPASSAEKKNKKTTGKEEGKEEMPNRKEVNVEALVRALGEKQAALAAARAERDALLAAAPRAYVALQEATAALDGVCAARGIREAEARVRALNRSVARQSRHNGTGMEAAAAASWRTALGLGGGGSPEAGARLHALRNVTLGTRAMEFDVVVVRDNGAGVPVTCVAIVEVKYNANDVGASFHHHQRSIAWLCGRRDAYDPARFVSPRFPTGHFDRPTTQRFGAHTVVFAPESFAHFAVDPASGCCLEPLYFAVHMDDAFCCAGCASSITSRLAATATTPPSVRALERYHGEAVQDYNFDAPDATPDATVAVIADFLAAASAADECNRTTTADVFRHYLRAGLANHIIRYVPQSPPMTNQ